MSPEPNGAPRMPVAVALRLIALPPISLSELDANTTLLTRTDRKYIIPWDLVGRVIDATGEQFAALSIDGRRVFTYRSRYFDSPSLDAFRAHVQGRRRRYKCRVRHYVDTNNYVFEVKLKGRRGQTVKKQLACESDAYDMTDETRRAFAAGCVREAYDAPVSELRPTIETCYQRVTLVARGGGERVTIDFGVTFDDGRGTLGTLDSGYVILETKSANALSEADRVLRRLGARPVNCSKYCIGIGLLRDGVHDNQLRWLTRRYFRVHAAASAPAQNGAEPLSSPQRGPAARVF